MSADAVWPAHLFTIDPTVPPGHIRMLTIDGRVRDVAVDSYQAHARTRDEGPGYTIDELIDNIDQVLDEHRSEP